MRFFPSGVEEVIPIRVHPEVKKNPKHRELIGLLVFSEALYLYLLRLDAVNGARPVLTFLAVMGALFALYAVAYRIIQRVRGRDRAALLVVVAGAVLFRLTLIPAGLPHDAAWSEKLGGIGADLGGKAVTYERFLLFDNDVWRFLWDGHVAAHGVNPYRYAPAEPVLDALADEDNPDLTDGRAVWSDIRANINYPATPTVYPPLAQLVFRLSHALAPGSVCAWKLLMVGFDLLAVWLMALTLAELGRPKSLVVLYAWNPLVVKVFAGSGHNDALLVAALAATLYFVVRGSAAPAAVAFALAVLAKLSPLVLLPFVARRIGRWGTALAGGVILAGYLPFLGAGRRLFTGFLTFARDWQFNAGTFVLLQWLAGLFTARAPLVARALSALVILAWVSWLARRDDGRALTFARFGAAALGALILLSPAVMPWYVPWVLPLALVAEQRLWPCFSALVCLAFLVMVNGTEYAGTLWLEYGFLAVLLGVECRLAASGAAAGPVPSSIRAVPGPDQ